jgi:hypothetical protein
MILPRHRLDLVERFHNLCPEHFRPEAAMMRIRPISTAITLLMAAIVLAAPVVVNLVLDIAHQQAPARIASSD